MYFQCSVFAVLCIFLSSVSQVESTYEDARCKCVCTVNNGTQVFKKLYIATVPPNNDCDGVMPLGGIIDNVDNKTEELCPRCICTYESRNTTVIKVVVIIVIWIISLLVIYMVFLMCLDPLLNKRIKGNYQEHTNEDDETVIVGPGIGVREFSGPSSGNSSGSAHPMGMRSGNVLNRVGHQQDKWKRQVMEQRKNIYDKHTMLN
uniref:Uncharacterized protein CG1161 n=1 Tax=Cacopsylla melanoneura TaxID=428564 RepID=A0A8D8QG66_9HEMI